MNEDPKIEHSLEFAGKRAGAAAVAFLEMLKTSDVPVLHWPEVVEHLKDLVVAELATRGLTLD